MSGAALGGRVVVDASVLLEAIGEFSHPPQARLLLERFSEDPSLELWVPDLAYPEVLSALRRLAAHGHVHPDDGARAIALLLELPLEVAGTSTLLEEAWTLRETVTAYDACYAALARRLAGTFLTADAALHRTLTALGDRVLLLSELG